MLFRSSEVTKKLTPLLKMFFDKNLYAFDSAKADPNFLDTIVRHEAGVKASDSAGTAITADAMVTRFTKDLWKLAQGGLTQNDGNSSNAQLAELSQALIAFAMQFYYQDTANAKDKTKELFTASEGSGSVSFTLNDVAASWGATKGKKYFDAYLAQSANGLSQVDRETIAMQISKMEQWFLQASSDGMNATADSKTAFMLGGQGNDTMTGSNVADLLVGNQGDDVLSGGQGNDTLLGGTGLDTYNFTGASFGKDTILDSDGSGTINMDGIALNGGKKQEQSENLWISDDKQVRYVLQSNGDLIITKAVGNDSITVKDWQTQSGNQLGIVLDNQPAPTSPPTGTLFYNGDQRAKLIGTETQLTVTPDKPGYGTYAWSETSWANDGTLTGGKAEVGFADVIDATGAGSNGAVMHGYGGNDALTGSSGKDDIFGDEGDDLIAGGAGSDNLRGGDGNDVIEIAMQFIAAYAYPISSSGRFDSKTRSMNDANWKVAA